MMILWAIIGLSIFGVAFLPRPYAELLAVAFIGLLALAGLGTRKQ